MNLDYEQLRMDVQQTVAADDFSTNHDIDGITTALWNHGIQSREDFDNHPDTDLFLSIVNDHELAPLFG